MPGLISPLRRGGHVSSDYTLMFSLLGPFYRLHQQNYEMHPPTLTIAIGPTRVTCVWSSQKTQALAKVVASKFRHCIFTMALHCLLFFAHCYATPLSSLCYPRQPSHHPSTKCSSRPCRAFHLMPLF